MLDPLNYARFFELAWLLEFCISYFFPNQIRLKFPFEKQESHQFLCWKGRTCVCGNQLIQLALICWKIGFLKVLTRVLPSLKPTKPHKVETPYHDNDLILIPIISPQSVELEVARNFTWAVFGMEDGNFWHLGGVTRRNSQFLIHTWTFFAIIYVTS